MKLLSVSEYAKLKGVTRSHIHQLLKDGKLPFKEVIKITKHIPEDAEIPKQKRGRRARKKKLKPI